MPQPPRAEAALLEAFAAALRNIPAGKRTWMPDLCSHGEEEDGGGQAAGDNPLASLLGHYRWVGKCTVGS